MDIGQPYQHDVMPVFFLMAFIERRRQIVKAIDLMPYEALKRLGPFVEVRPRQTTSYQEFIALHERKS